MDDRYKMVGIVKISENRKAEFNRYVMQILDQCGIRKTEMLALAGKMVRTVSKPIPDESGIVRFDYSIFEKKIRKTSSYDMNSCTVITSDRGYEEYGLTMNLIMVLQESFSEKPCFLMDGDDLCCNITARQVLDTLPPLLDHAHATAVEREDVPELYFYKAIQRKNEDEFLEYWNDGELKLSDEMKERLDAWKERYKQIPLPDKFDMEVYLAEIVEDMSGDWKCRLPDSAFVKEFIACQKDTHKKALLLLREMMDRDTKFFPELTRRQAVRWIIRGKGEKFDFTAMSAYLSLLVNHGLRMKILGF